MKILLRSIKIGYLINHNQSRMVLALMAILMFSVTIVSAQIVDIPDPNFKEYLVNNEEINTNGDDEIQVSEAASFTGTIDCKFLQISDLTGIKAFTSLYELDCSYTNIKNLDISGHPSLNRLRVRDCELEFLDASNCPSLTYLNVYGNLELDSLTIKNSNQLTFLEVGFCNLSTLSLDTHTQLTRLGCSNNLLTELDLSNCPLLESVTCDDNELVNLDLTGCNLLAWLQCNANQLDSLDVSNKALLVTLLISNNNLKYLNVANGNNQNWSYWISNEPDLLGFKVNNNPNLTCIQVDDSLYSTNNWTDSRLFDPQHWFSENCYGSGTVSTGIASFKTDFRIYPNPAQNNLYIEQEKTDSELRIYNQAGKTMISQRLNDTRAAIDISALAGGMYIVELKNGKNLSREKVIVTQK